MPASRGRSTRRSETREKLVRAAGEVVARNGFENASVDAIADRAGYSIGALYSNFRGKDDLFLAVFDQHVAWFEERLAQASGASDRSAAFAEWFAEIATDPQQFVIFVEFWAYAVRKPETRRRLAKRLTEMRARVAELLGDERLALMSLATARGLALEKLVDGRAVPDQVVREVSAAALGR